jgi:endonuclease III
METSGLSPEPGLLRVAARLGYPGTTAAALIHALEAELPGGNPHELAARATSAFESLAARHCHRHAPRCSSCPIEDRCSYRGEGVDPAGWLLDEGGGVR